MKKLIITALALSSTLWANGPSIINESNFKKIVQGWSEFNLYAFESITINEPKDCIRNEKHSNCMIATPSEKSTIAISGNAVSTVYTQGTVKLAPKRTFKNSITIQI